MERKKLAFHLASNVRLYLEELQEIYSFQKEVYKFFTKTYSNHLDKDHLSFKIFKEIDKHFLGERNNQLFKMIIVSCLSIFEAFNKDFFRDLYTFKPEYLKRKKKVNLSYEELIEFNSMETLYEGLARRKVDKYGRMSIEEFAEELEKKYKFDLTKDFTKWKALKENYYRRNIIVHNKGDISKDYTKK